MSLHTRTQFYKLCGVTRGYLNMYIKRKKVIVRRKLIDDAVPENAYFLQNCLSRKSENGEIEKPEKLVSPMPDELVKDAVRKQVNGNSGGSKFDMEIEIKELEIIKKKEDIEIAKIKRAKMAGEVIPTELVLLIFASHFKSVTTSFHQAAEVLITTIAKQNNLDRKQIARIRGELIEVVNGAVSEGLKSSKKEMKHLVNEYSLRRNESS